jgi:hypothetical protein
MCMAHVAKRSFLSFEHPHSPRQGNSTFPLNRSRDHALARVPTWRCPRLPPFRFSPAAALSSSSTALKGCVYLRDSGLPDAEDPRRHRTPSFHSG